MEKKDKGEGQKKVKRSEVQSVGYRFWEGAKVVSSYGGIGEEPRGEEANRKGERVHRS